MTRSRLQVVRSFHDVQPFARRAEPFLLARECVHGVLLGLCGELQRNPHLFGAEPPVLRTVDEAGAVVFVALQTPPYRLVLSSCDRPAALAALARALHDEGRALPGVVGPAAVAEEFARWWQRETGRPATMQRAQRIYQLTAVRPPAPSPGAMRMATASDRALLLRWFDAFQREAIGEALPAGVDAEVDRWFAADGRCLYLWEDGIAVSLAGVVGATPNGIRVGPVYTPPERRGRGYASKLVAAVSQAQLDAGRRWCVLYTDLANPTSNRIYQAIGYQPAGDSVELSFEPMQTKGVTPRRSTRS